ncbi:MAG: PaaI family thioesterase [Candidatus Hydrogenedens sp.]
MEIKNKGIDKKLFEYLHQSIETTPYYNLLGIHLDSLSKGEVVMYAVPETKHANPMGFVHGGLVMSLLDAVMGNAVRSLGIKSVTVDISIAFPKGGAFDTTLYAEGKVVHAGKHVLFAEGKVYSGKDIIGYGKGTFYKIGEIEL